MELIPVLDLRHGVVVRAQRGARHTYQPVRSALCEGARPLDVARALLRHTAAGTLYLADLDALQGGAVQQPLLAALLQALPGTTLWLDAGFADWPQAQALLATLGAEAVRVRPVFGSESLASLAALQALPADTAVLSLDRRDGTPMDPAGCWQRPECWLPTTIAMTLERVGSGAGPDLETLAMLRRRAPAVHHWVGSGGVRHPADLAAGATAGARAWLVASALHDGAWPAA